MVKDNKAMKADIRPEARQLLDSYLDAGGYHKTAERYAIFDAAYGFIKPFTIDDLRSYIAENEIRVSRATLYNAVNLFVQMGLLTSHILPSGTFYDVHRHDVRGIYQYCTVCGKLCEVHDHAVESSIEALHKNRFHRDGFCLYIYGLCSSCQAKMNRIKKKTNK